MLISIMQAVGILPLQHTHGINCSHAVAAAVTAALADISSFSFLTLIYTSLLIILFANLWYVKGFLFYWWESRTQCQSLTKEKQV